MHPELAAALQDRGCNSQHGKVQSMTFCFHLGLVILRSSTDTPFDIVMSCSVSSYAPKPDMLCPTDSRASKIDVNQPVPLLDHGAAQSWLEPLP